MKPGNRLLSLKYLVSSIPQKTRQIEKLQISPIKKPEPVDLNQLVWDAYDLNSYFKLPNTDEPLKSLLVKSDTLFHVSRTKHEWTCSSYADLPDVKVQRMEEERLTKLQLIEPYRWNEYHGNLLRSRTSFGVDPLLLKPLPEVLFVGHTNAGKSSLINNVFASRELARLASSETNLAFESSKAGFTQCLISFNVSSRLRLIDTPGYGDYSAEEQGSLVLDYILQRNQLMKTYMVIDGTVGFRPGDELLMNHLQGAKRPFEIVFSRLDEVVKKKFPKDIVKKKTLLNHELAHELATEGNSRVVEHFLKIMEQADMDSYSMLTGVYFNNSQSNNVLKRRSGYRALRASMMKTCQL